MAEGEGVNNQIPRVDPGQNERRRGEGEQVENAEVA